MQNQPQSNTRRFSSLHSPVHSFNGYLIIIDHASNKFLRTLTTRRCNRSRASAISDLWHKYSLPSCKFPYCLLWFVIFEEFFKSTSLYLTNENAHLSVKQTSFVLGLFNKSKRKHFGIAVIRYLPLFAWCNQQNKKQNYSFPSSSKFMALSIRDSLSSCWRLSNLDFINI